MFGVLAENVLSPALIRTYVFVVAVVHVDVDVDVDVENEERWGG